MPITLTEQATQKIKEIYRQDPGLEGKALRIYIEAGGCSGFSYGFKFDSAAPTDSNQPFDGFNLIVDPESQKYIDGAIVDYKVDFGQEGFAIQNPNAKKSCGCGHSFEA